MAKELNPIEIANRNSVTLGDLVVIDAENVARIVQLEEDTLLAEKGFQTYIRSYANSIVLKNNRTGYLIGDNLLRTR